MERPLILDAAIPMPIQIVIDDVGWWSGEDGHERGEPYRTGMCRHHSIEDYGVLAYLGRSLGMRPQAGLVLCEWDRHNLLRSLPSATWMGTAWDNAKWAGPWLEKAARLLLRYNDYIEPALHGLGHEYWENGVMSRAEWHDAEGNMRPRDEVLRHIELFIRILDQHRMGALWPSSFVPAAFLHHFGAEGGGLAAILGEYGINFISTPFDTMHRSREPEEKHFGMDCGVMTVDRGKDCCLWNDLGADPKEPVLGPICGMHWANLLHEDPARNREVADRWVEALEPYRLRMDTMLASDTRSFRTQLIYHDCAELVRSDDVIDLDVGKASSYIDANCDKWFAVRVTASCRAAFSVSGATLVGVKPVRENETHTYELLLGNVPRGERPRITAVPEPRP